MHTYALGMYHSGHFYALFFLIYRDITRPHDLPASVLLDDSMFQLNAQQFFFWILLTAGTAVLKLWIEQSISTAFIWIIYFRDITLLEVTRQCSMNIQEYSKLVKNCRGVVGQAKVLISYLVYLTHSFTFILRWTVFIASVVYSSSDLWLFAFAYVLKQ